MAESGQPPHLLSSLIGRIGHVRGSACAGLRSSWIMQGLLVRSTRGQSSDKVWMASDRVLGLWPEARGNWAVKAAKLTGLAAAPAFFCLHSHHMGLDATLPTPSPYTAFITACCPARGVIYCLHRCPLAAD